MPASDIYALGLLTIEALTGTKQFVGESIQATILARLTRHPEVPGGLGQGWRSILTAMTSLDPSSRPTAEVFQRVRARLRSERPGHRDRVAGAGGGLLCATVRRLEAEQYGCRATDVHFGEVGGAGWISLVDGCIDRAVLAA